MPAPRDRVFDALIDPAILMRCIPGCEALVETAPDSYDATLSVGLAGMKGSYRGRASIRDKARPDALTLAFDGRGAPGWVRGTASIALTDDGGGTRVASDVDVQVGGVIAAVGSRLVDVAARKLADDFFTRLSNELTSA